MKLWQALVLLLISSSQCLALTGAHRIESIKQHALALNTVSASDQRRFANETVAILRQDHQDARLLAVKVWINGQLWADMPLVEAEATTLREAGALWLGVMPISKGEHRIRAEIQILARDRKGNTRQQTLSEDAVVSLGPQPRGLQFSLGVASKSQAELSIRTGFSATDVLAAARHSLNRGRPSQALSTLQTLSVLRPGATHDVSYKSLMAESLRDWGLESAAEASFAQIIQTPSDRNSANEARLNAAALALKLKHFEAAEAYLSNEKWTSEQSSTAAVLRNRLMLENPQATKASVAIPRDAPLLAQYNLAVSVKKAGDTKTAEDTLQHIGTASPTNRYDQWLQQRSNLGLAYWQLDRNQASEAYATFGRIPPESEFYSSAQLGQGWAALAEIVDGQLDRFTDDRLRPRFAQRIDSVVHSIPHNDSQKQEKLKKALLRALESWTRLRDGDPMDLAVQEALVAIPYTLALMGADARAIDYGEQAIARLEAVRDGLSRVYTKAMKGQPSLDVANFNRTAWPPTPGSWAPLTSQQAWWSSAGHKVPEDAHMRFLLSDSQVLEILAAMQALTDAQTMIKQYEDHPDLGPRARQLQERIEAERGVQQKALNRVAWTWLGRRGTLTTRYLIMARLIVGQMRSRQQN